MLSHSGVCSWGLEGGGQMVVLLLNLSSHTQSIDEMPWRFYVTLETRP